eukprot:GHVU01140407.1.p1 GENE.GHVU01140407.1~~GHVU01140407.1.p1  ORF type:complete len:123 (+),score=18.35 GHVU01140407.1:47-370(+)
MWAAADKADILGTNYAAATSVGAWVHGKVGSVVVCNKYDAEWGTACDVVGATTTTTTTTTTTSTTSSDSTASPASPTSPASPNSNGMKTRGFVAVSAAFVSLAVAAA